MQNTKRYFLRLRLLISISLLSIAYASAHSPTHAQTLQGTIAYVRDNDITGDEIWLIEPDGSNNRLIWRVGEGDPENIDDLSDLDWRPDASEIAFASDHEFACSRFDSDLYSIRPDGSGYRRITNGPHCAALDTYPKGDVSVTVRNFSTRNPLFVYVQGAPSVQMVLVAGGNSATVTFEDVADLGEEVLQQAVAIWGNDRWVAPIAAADVEPGQTVHAGRIDVSGEGIPNLGAYIPTWHSSGLRLGYILVAAGNMYQVARITAAGDHGPPLLNLGVSELPSADIMDWGPMPALADQILYASYLNGGIYRVTEGSDDRGTLLVATQYEGIVDLQWLPDGSGFLYTKQNYLDRSNIYHYDFATGDTTELSHFTNEFAIDISISPDGAWIVFERSSANSLTSGDIWLMRMDGTQMHLLVRDGMRPSWSSQEAQLPSSIRRSGLHPHTPR